MPIIEDIKNVNRDSVNEPVTLISGGPPCQPFSVAGKRRGKEDDRHLWPEMFRVIQELKPTWVLGENVAGFVNMGLDDALFDLESAGYEAQPFLIPACGVGAPHPRSRIFFVAHSKSNGRKGPICGDIKNRKDTGWPQSQSPGPLDTRLYIFEEYKKRMGEPAVFGMDDGISHRVDRLKALGNAVVPAQVYPILRAIAEIGGDK